MVPNKLYRGDSDNLSVRQLRNHLLQGFLMTNLISGGYGNEIFRKPFLELVKKHIIPGWEKTHFLSFTKLKNKAYEFGFHGFSGEFNLAEDYDNWDFALLTFNTARLSKCLEIEKGVFECFYESSLLEFKEGCKILLVDTVQYLESHLDFNVDTQLQNANKDEEWLILPNNTIILNNNSIEYSAKISMDDIIDFELYKVY